VTAFTTPYITYVGMATQTWSTRNNLLATHTLEYVRVGRITKWTGI